MRNAVIVNLFYETLQLLSLQVRHICIYTEQQLLENALVGFTNQNTHVTCVGEIMMSNILKAKQQVTELRRDFIITTANILTPSFAIAVASLNIRESFISGKIIALFSAIIGLFLIFIKLMDTIFRIKDKNDSINSSKTRYNIYTENNVFPIGQLERRIGKIKRDTINIYGHTEQQRQRMELLLRQAIYL